MYILIFKLSREYIYRGSKNNNNNNNKIARHHVFNDIIWRAVGAAGIPAVKEPSGLDRQDGKRPDGLTLIPWHGGRSLLWDVTVVSPLAASYVDRAATDAGTVEDMIATRKTEKYSTLSSAYRFEPIAVENLGVFSSTTLNLSLIHI